jgi:2-polyprenyl-6-methoxyphenol hydroxylase-like FAD-dependent oxidoreductase
LTVPNFAESPCASIMKNLNVVVVGAGIGGLQTALALAADGHKITLLESVKEFAEVAEMVAHS